MSFSSVPLGFFGGTLHANPKSAEFFRFTNAGGVWAQTFPWPGGLPPGTQFWLQFLVQDLSVPSQISMSNALTAVSP